MLPTDVVIAHDGKRRRRAAADREDAHREPERLLRRRNLQPAIHGGRISGRSVQPPAISQAMSSARRRCPALAGTATKAILPPLGVAQCAGAPTSPLAYMTSVPSALARRLLPPVRPRVGAARSACTPCGARTRAPACRPAMAHCWRFFGPLSVSSAMSFPPPSREASSHPGWQAAPSAWDWRRGAPRQDRARDRARAFAIGRLRARPRPHSRQSRCLPLRPWEGGAERA
jgi:hypothetical protein